MIKAFKLNERGNIEITKDELETILNEVWQDAYINSHQFWWVPPQWPARKKPFRISATDRDDPVLVYTTSTPEEGNDA